MFLSTRPDLRRVLRFLDDRADDRFSYPEVGATHGAAPTGYNVDHNRMQIGSGKEVFEWAKMAVRNWKMFDMPWVQLVSDTTPLEVGNTVAIVVRHFGFYSLNAARIVYILDETGTVERFGFAYGTLKEHGEIGEERFSVEFHAGSDEVWYDLFAFSRPAAFLSTIGYPFSRHLQKAFARDSMLAMCRAATLTSAPHDTKNIVLEK